MTYDTTSYEEDIPLNELPPGCMVIWPEDPETIPDYAANLALSLSMVEDRGAADANGTTTFLVLRSPDDTPHWAPELPTHWSELSRPVEVNGDASRLRIGVMCTRFSSINAYLDALVGGRRPTAVVFDDFTILKALYGEDVEEQMTNWAYSTGIHVYCVDRSPPESQTTH